MKKIDCRRGIYNREVADIEAIDRYLEDDFKCPCCELEDDCCSFDWEDGYEDETNSLQDQIDSIVWAIDLLAEKLGVRVDIEPEVPAIPAKMVLVPIKKTVKKVAKKAAKKVAKKVNKKK